MLEKFTKIYNVHIAASICLGLQDLSSSIYRKYSSLKWLHVFKQHSASSEDGVAVGLYSTMDQRREAPETGSDAWQEPTLPAGDICSGKRLHRGIRENNAS